VLECQYGPPLAIDCPGRNPRCVAGEPDIAEQLEVLEKLGLPPGREHTVPLPVRTGGGGGSDGDESVHGSPHGLE